MSYLSDAYLQERFDLDSLSHQFQRLAQRASQDPIFWYLFLHRYSYFNSHATAAALRLASAIALSRYEFVAPGTLVPAECDCGFKVAQRLLSSSACCEFEQRRQQVQSILAAAGDFAGLLPVERNGLAAAPDWLLHLINEFVKRYAGVPQDIVLLTNGVGVHIASEIQAETEQQRLQQIAWQDDTFSQCLRAHWPVSDEAADPSLWYRLISRPGRLKSAAVSLLELLSQHRSESIVQIRCWVLEGFATFVSIQRLLLTEIERELTQLSQLSAAAAPVCHG
ncbi:MAG: hypothetical protein F6J97_07440 [Leptolyngbya sp. SIO4C1]|nr:hypothetical protein [Leptolyngbya sp. SIO4C1]